MVSNENKIKILKKKNKKELFQIVKTQAKKYRGYSRFNKLDLINLIVNNKNDFLAIHQEIDPDAKLDEINDGAKTKVINKPIILNSKPVKKNKQKKSQKESQKEKEIKKAQTELKRLKNKKKKSEEEIEEIEELEEYIETLENEG